VANRAAIKAEAEARKIPFIDLGETDATAWIAAGNKQTYHPTSGVIGTGVLSGEVVTSISHNTGGVYGVVPSAVISGGGGSGATASVTANGRLVSATVIDGGTGYTTAGVTVGGDGTGAQFTASVSGGRVTHLTLVNKGSGYTYPPPITIDGDGSGAIALSGWGYEVTAITVTNGGSGYTSPPSVSMNVPTSDGTHPNLGGHVYYAERLAYELQRLRNP
jgi:hypothetical protein